jgi:hypothetical protein
MFHTVSKRGFSVSHLEGVSEVMEVAQREGVGLDGRGLDDAVEQHPVTMDLEDTGADQLGAVMAAVALSHLKRTERGKYKLPW